VPDILRPAAALLPAVVDVNAEEWPPPQEEPTTIAPRIIKTADNRLIKVGLAHAFSVRSIKQKNIDLAPKLI
jgi:hypothetical protein